MSRFLSDEEMAEFEENERRLQDEIKAIPSALAAKTIVDEEFGEIQKNLDSQFVTEGKVRALGLSTRDTEDLALLMKSSPVGNVVLFRGKFFVKTPYDTVVPAEVYINSLQDTLISVTGAAVSFTNLGFIDLIVLAFKRLFRRA